MGRNTPDDPGDGDGGNVRGGGSGRATPDEPVRVRGGSTRPGDGEGYNYGRKVWSGGAGGSTSVSESSVSFSTTILDAIIPVVYGSRKVSGLCAALKEYSGGGGWLHCAYVFSYGEQDSITDLQLNDTPITDPELTGALFNINYRLGAAGETVPAHIAANLPDDARMVRYCYVTFTIRLDQLTLPGALNVSAILGGRKVEPVAGATGGTKVMSTNPVLVANDILTDGVAWKGIDASNIDAASWLAAAQTCNELVSGEKRYSYQARVTERSPEKAAAEALMHGLAYTFNDVGSSIKLWQERRPRAATGTWSTSGSSTTVTRSGLGDAFDSDYEGKRVFFDNEHRQVVAVVAADQVTVSEAIDLTAATLRYPSGIELQPGNMVATPLADEIELGSVPDVVIVKYIDPDEWGSIQYPELVDDSVIKRKEVQLYGCTEAGMARRHSETRRDIDLLQPFIWQLAADGIAAPVEPGDVLFFTDDVLTNQAVRVVPPVTALKSGAYALKLRQFNMAAYSDNTAIRPTQLDPPVLPLDLPGIDYTLVTNNVPNEWGDTINTESFNWEADVSSVAYPGRYEVVVQGYDGGSVYSDSSQPWVDLQVVEFTQGGVQLAKVGGGPTDTMSRQLLDSTKGITDYRLAIKEKGRADRRLMTETTRSNFSPAPGPRLDGMTQRFDGSLWEIAYLQAGDLENDPLGTTGWPSGVQDAFRANTDLLFVDSTRTFTLDVTAAVDYWIKGELYSLALGADPSMVLPETEGTYRVYLKADGTLGYSTTFDVDALLKENAYLTSIYLAADGGDGTLSYDFETDTVGLPPAGWAEVYKTGASTGNVIAGKSWRLQPASSGDIVYYENTDMAGTEEDILCEFEFTKNNGGTNSIVMIRHNGYAGNDGYILNCTGGTMYLNSYIDGVSQGSLGTAAKTMTNGVTYEVKFEAVGTTVRAKMWQKGTAEPAWDISNTDADHAAGGVVMGSYAYYTDYDNVAITSADLPTGFEHLTMLDERHDLMNPITHAYLHDRFSAYIKSGYAIGNIIDDGSGDLDSHAEFSIENGVIVDEDFPHSTAAILTSGNKPLFYLSGSAPFLRRADIDNVPIYKPATGLAYWNSFSAGSWGLTSVTQNDYMHVWVLATNNHPNEPGGGIACIMGQAEYNTVSAARAGAPTELASIVSILQLEESAFIGGILYQCSTGYSNTWGARVRPDADGNPYWDLRQSEIGSGAPPGDHGALTGRSSPSQHPDTALDLSGTHTGLLAAATTVDDAMAVLDDLAGSDLSIDDVDVAITSTYTDWLSGISGTVQDALEAIDGLAAGLYMRNAAGLNWRQVTGPGPYGWILGVGVDSSDVINIGLAGGAHVRIDLHGDVLIDGGDLQLENTKGVFIENSGGKLVNAISMSASDVLNVGDGTTQLSLSSDGEIDAGDNDIATTGDLIAAAADVPRIKATQTKTLGDGTSTEVARAFLQGSAPTKATVVMYYEIQATNLAGTDIQTETGTATFTMLRNSAGVNTALTAVKAGTINGATSGALTVAVSVGTAGSDHMRIRFLANSDFGTPTITGKFIIVGNADAAVTWS